jgi:hypothetical protein
MVGRTNAGGGKKRLITQLFTYDTSFTIPDGVKQLFLRLFGGGSAGSSAGSNGGPGGSGGHMSTGTFTVVSGDEYTVTVAKPSSSNGEVTSFGTLLSASGGSTSVSVGATAMCGMYLRSGTVQTEVPWILRGEAVLVWARLHKVRHLRSGSNNYTITACGSDVRRRNKTLAHNEQTLPDGLKYKGVV